MTVVDLFAGARGWDLGARAIGIDPVGVENWAPAIATATAAGFRTIKADLSHAYVLQQWAPVDVEGLIASPPCPDWSAAGSRAKREGSTGWLVDVPMQWARALRPRWLAWEQVPPALEVWEANAIELRSLGYSVWTGILNAADYGVPQTRQRAILMASLDRPALPPEPTHAKDPHPTLFGDQLRPWVTMADALSFDGVDPAGHPVPADGLRWAVKNMAQWVFERPATTVCADPRIAPPGHRDREGGESQFPEGTVRLTVEQALILQSFPADYPVQGTKTERFTQVGNAVPPLLAEKIIGALA